MKKKRRSNTYTRYPSNKSAPSYQPKDEKSLRENSVCSICSNNKIHLLLDRHEEKASDSCSKYILAHTVNTVNRNSGLKFKNEKRQNTSA